MSGERCSVCGEELGEVKPCLYNRMGIYTCDKCCEHCFASEPFPCHEHDLRTEKRKDPSK